MDVIIARSHRSCLSHRLGSWFRRSSLIVGMITFVIHDEGEDEEGECEDGSEDGAATIRPFPFFFLHWEILERMNIVPEQHFKSKF